MVSREGTEPVRLAFPALGEEELAEVRAVFESGALTMGPKVEAATDFVVRTGNRAAIGTLADVGELVAGTRGTNVIAG